MGTDVSPSVCVTKMERLTDGTPGPAPKADGGEGLIPRQDSQFQSWDYPPPSCFVAHFSFFNASFTKFSSFS